MSLFVVIVLVDIGTLRNDFQTHKYMYIVHYAALRMNFAPQALTG